MSAFGIIISGIVILGSTLAYIIWLVKRKL
jgi:hypothetical protein